MDTDTAVDARRQLDALREELTGRGWHADHRGTPERPVLYVRNPLDAGLHDGIAIMDGCYIWRWGTEIGPVGQVTLAAERVMHVLRMVGL